MNQIDVTNVYTALQNLADAVRERKIEDNTKTDEPKTDVSKIVSEVQQLMLKVEEESSKQVKLQTEFLASFGKEKPKEIVNSKPAVIKNYSVFGQGEIGNLKNTFLITLFLVFFYFVITFLISFLSETDELKESKRRYQTFYLYHYYDSQSSGDIEKQKYLVNTLKLITDEDPNFMKNFKKMEEDFLKIKEKYELEKRLKELNNDH